MIIYINGNKHRCDCEGNGFFADTPELPGRRCSWHVVGPSAMIAIRDGLTVRTIGNVYSRNAPQTVNPPTPPRTDAVHVAPTPMDYGKPLHKPSTLPSMFTQEQVDTRVRKVAYRLIASALFIEVARYVLT